MKEEIEVDNMKLFRRLRLQDKYQVEPSKEPDDEGKYIVFHITKSLRGCNYQRVFKGSFKECHNEKEKLEKIRKENIKKYIHKKGIYLK